jgi:tetratricopeptide (TPR) repeat protein
MRLFACATLAAILSAVFGWTSLAGAAPEEDVSIGASPAAALEEQGLDFFYNLEYDQATRVFQRLRDADPNNPALHNHVATVSFYQQLYVAGVLQGDLFANSNRFFRNRKIQPDPALEKTFRDANQNAIQLCEQRLKQNGGDQEALFDCGTAYASRASWQGLIERAKIATLVSGRKANDYNLELLRVNPSFYDANLIPGLFQYVVGSMPGSLKFFLYFAGIAGDKEQGISQVETVAHSGTRNKHDARVMLAVIYRREKRFADAQSTLAQLAQAYPRNFIFPLEIASLYRTEGDTKAAINAYEQVLADVEQGKPGFDRAPAARIHLELGQLYWNAGDPSSAKAHIDKVSGSPGSTPEIEVQNATLRRVVEEVLRDKQPPKQTPARRCCGAR